LPSSDLWKKVAVSKQFFLCLKAGVISRKNWPQRLAAAFNGVCGIATEAVGSDYPI
jgi:hypothetical protein